MLINKEEAINIFFKRVKELVYLQKNMVLNYL